MWSLGSWWREAGTDFLPQPLSVLCYGPVSPSPENTVYGLSQRVPSFQTFYFYCQIKLHLTYPQRKVFVTGNICFVLLAVSVSFTELYSKVGFLEKLSAGQLVGVDI